MKLIAADSSKLRNFLMIVAWFSSVFFAGAGQVFAHGGEDHGGGKPKTETTDKGTVSHTTRVGDLEVMLKHQLLVPDAAQTARLFVTKYETNEGFNDVVPAIEIEAASGAVTQAEILKTKAGSFTVKIPPLAEGAYLIRAKLTHAGETDTATFSGVRVENAAASVTGGGSWTQTAVTALIFLVALALFGALVYLAVRTLRNKPLRGEAVSA